MELLLGFGVERLGALLFGAERFGGDLRAGGELLRVVVFGLVDLLGVEDLRVVGREVDLVVERVLVRLVDRLVVVDFFCVERFDSERLKGGVVLDLRVVLPVDLRGVDDLVVVLPVFVERFVVLELFVSDFR